MNESEVQQLLDYCEAHLKLADIRTAEDYGYRSLALCVIDAVFSIGVTYISTRNTIHRFETFLKLDAPYPLMISSHCMRHILSISWRRKSIKINNALLHVMASSRHKPF